MLRCNIHFNQLPRRSGCYVVSCSIHFCELPSCSGCYVVTSVSINFQDALDTTLYQPCEATSRTLWMLRSNICFSELPRRAGCCVVPSLSSIVQDASMFEGSLAQKNFDKIQHLVLEAVSAAWYGLKLLSSIIAVGWQHVFLCMHRSAAVHISPRLPLFAPRQQFALLQLWDVSHVF